MKKRTICIVTGTRADYGLLFWLMKEIQSDDDLCLQIIATGMHLSPEFDLTYRLIEKDGFCIDAKVEMLLSSDTPAGIAKSIGLGVIGCADALERLKPDLLVVLGDRFEILAAAQAALVMRIPIAHIHGGEITEGAIDESIRHAITKMAHLHFTAAEPYRQRVIQLGEQPDYVMNAGAPGLDAIKRMNFMSREELELSLDFSLGNPTFLVTYHPATLESQGPEQSLHMLFCALEKFNDASIIFTKANADAGGRMINAMIDEFVQKHKERMIAFTTLGQQRYISVLKQADIVIGNSSSGIIEAPFLRTPTVDIGDRQRGRLQADSIIHCEGTEEAIVEAIRKALSPEFQEMLSHIQSVYGTGNASCQIKERLENVDLGALVVKQFYDFPQEKIQETVENI